MIPAVDNVQTTPKEPEVKEENKIEQQQAVQSVPETPKVEEKPEDPNWRAFREARKKDRADKEAAEKRAAEKEAEAAALKAAMEAAFSREQPQPYRQDHQYGQQYAQGESEDEKIDRRVREIIAEREKQYAKEYEERERKEAPQKLMRTLPDFNQVVTQDNCDYIDYHYPELTAPFKHMPEGYDKWVAMYNVVKKFVPNHANANRDMQRAESNLQKPKSMSAPGMTQMPDNMGSKLSEDRKAANWARMQATLKGLS